MRTEDRGQGLACGFSGQDFCHLWATRPRINHEVTRVGCKHKMAGRANLARFALSAICGRAHVPTKSRDSRQLRPTANVLAYYLEKLLYY